MKIGLALGSGSSRGWSHIGIITALSEQGIVPDIVCGTSIGSLVGASYVSHNLEKLEQWVLSLTKFDTVRFFEINPSFNGFVNKERLHQFLSEHVAGDESSIEKTDKPYAAVATDLETGREIWLTKGSVLKAVWSSIAMPGLFPAIKYHNKWLVDGGLVNPVPVSVCRALGADVVIAVNLSGVVGNNFQRSKKTAKQSMGVIDKITDFIRDDANAMIPSEKDDERPPNVFEAIAGSVNITQHRITRSRMAGDPPDILLSPRLTDIGLLEFYRAREAIQEGKNCVQRMLPEIQHLLDSK